MFSTILNIFCSITYLLFYIITFYFHSPYAAHAHVPKSEAEKSNILNFGNRESFENDQVPLSETVFEVVKVLSFVHS